MRFDDSLDTVLSAEMSTPFGAQSTWRQLVDLIGRGRAEASTEALQRLRSIRADVPPPVRAASARALAAANPPAALVALFAEDEIVVAAPVLRAAQLPAAAWTALLPDLSPTARSILRHRRDLPPDVSRALDSFGSVDFVLDAPPSTAAEEGAPAQSATAAEVAPVEPVMAAAEIALAEPVIAAAPEPVPSDPIIVPLSIDWTELVAESDVAASFVIAPLAPEPEATPVEAPTQVRDATPHFIAPPPSSFVSIASVVQGLPVVAEAIRQAGEPTDPTEAVAAPFLAAPLPSAEIVPLHRPEPPQPVAESGTFEIAELVARIDAYQRQRDEAPTSRAPLEIQPELFEHDPAQAESFRFETDAAGVMRWIEGAARAPLIGLSLDLAQQQGGARVDGVAAGAFRRRAGFAHARLVVDGVSDAAGQWRISGIPVFDRASGRFTGYRGSARRPRADESAEPVREGRDPAADALRQLVHELRTPTNAIAGFAEMIESQMLGPVPAAYRAHAAAIRAQSGSLLTAIDDIDMAARIETRALDLRATIVPVRPLIERIIADLTPLATLRGTMIDRFVADHDLAIAGDDRAVERLVARLSATLVASGTPGERIGIAATREDGGVAIVFDRPTALTAYSEAGLLTIDAEAESERDGAPLLGTGFALRLARNLATELGGSLTIGDKSLTLRLPAAVTAAMEQASSN